MNVNIKLEHPEAKIPTKAHSTDAGFDLAAVSITQTDQYIEYDTGVVVEIPKNHVGLVFPRSSISKYDLSLCNSTAVIDVGYLGTIKLRFSTKKESDNKIYVVGDRIGQLVIIPYPEVQFSIVDSFAATERNTGGFGSTNK
jgi:dUTP pyrophosphatase